MLEIVPASTVGLTVLQKSSLPPAGVEPATLGLLDPRSNRLSYGGTSMEALIDSGKHS